jgi:hypothetical protein
MGGGGADWNNVSLDREKWWAHEKTTMNFQVPQMQVIS